jgi:hypothetical protein
MEASIPVRPRPVQEADSQELEIGDDVVPKDGLDHTGKEHVVEPLIESGADIIVPAEPESARSVSPIL